MFAHIYMTCCSTDLPWCKNKWEAEQIQHDVQWILTSQVREASGLSMLPARSSFTMLCMLVRLLITSSTRSSVSEERLDSLAAIAVSLQIMQELYVCDIALSARVR